MENLACDLNALSTDELKQSLKDSVALFQTIDHILPLEEGYAIQFVDSDTLIPDLAKLMSVNRYCCPFIRQELLVETHRGDIWLHLTGSKGVKEFIAADLAAIIPPSKVHLLQRDNATVVENPS